MLRIGVFFAVIIVVAPREGVAQQSTQVLLQEIQDKIDSSTETVTRKIEKSIHTFETALDNQQSPFVTALNNQQDAFVTALDNQQSAFVAELEAQTRSLAKVNKLLLVEMSSLSSTIGSLEGVQELSTLVRDTNKTLVDVNTIQTLLHKDLTVTEDKVTELRMFAYVFLGGGLTLACVVVGAFIGPYFKRG